MVKAFIKETVKVEVESLKTNVENLRGSVEKLSPKECVKGADTVLWGSERAPANPRLQNLGGCAPWVLQPRFALKNSHVSPHTAPQHSEGMQALS